MNLKQMVKQRVGDDKYPTLKRIKYGRGLMVIVALPLGTLWLAPVAIALMIPMKPSLWAKDKIRSFKEWRTLI
jgi:hypothetical protein